MAREEIRRLSTLYCLAYCCISPPVKLTESIFVKENSHRLRIMYLPTGCPELSAIEECWHQLKIQPFMYEHHEHVSGRARAALKYLRTAAFSQNIEQYLFRKPIAKIF